MTHYIVQSAAAQMPSSVKARYRRVAVLEVQEGLTYVSMISKHAKGVIRVVKTWEKLHVGKTDKSAYNVALAEATALAAQLNDDVTRVAQEARDRAKRMCESCNRPIGYGEHTCPESK